MTTFVMFILLAMFIAILLFVFRSNAHVTKTVTSFNISTTSISQNLSILSKLDVWIRPMVQNILDKYSSIKKELSKVLEQSSLFVEWFTASFKNLHEYLESKFNETWNKISELRKQTDIIKQDQLITHQLVETIFKQQQEILTLLKPKEMVKEIKEELPPVPYEIKEDVVQLEKKKTRNRRKS